MAVPQVDRLEIFVVPTRYKRSFVLGSTPSGDAATMGEVVFVRVETADGVVGWGEQRALPSWSYETAQTMVSVIERDLAPIVVGHRLDVASFHRSAARRLKPAVSSGFPFARAAVDIALHDALGIASGLPVHALLGGQIVGRIPLCSAIGVDTPEGSAERARESANLHAYKIKVSGRPALDAGAIRAVAQVADGKPLWLDANQSYRPSALRQLLHSVEGVPGLWCVEQPVGSLDWAGMRRVRQAGWLPVAIDEGCFSATDVARAAALEAADMVVVKVCKAGGLRAAQRSAAVAASHGLELLGSGLTDCGVSFAASVHLFAGMDLALPAELNGPQLLADLFVEGIEIRGGCATVPQSPGLGVTVDESRIRAEAVNG